MMRKRISFVLKWRRGLLAVALLALAAGCGEGQRIPQQTRLVFDLAPVGKAAGPIPDVFFVRVEALPLVLDPLDPASSDFGDPAKPILTSSEALGSKAFDINRDCNMGMGPCVLTMVLPIPPGQPLEIRAYLFEVESALPAGVDIWNSMRYGAAPYLPGSGNALDIFVDRSDDIYMHQAPPPAPPQFVRQNDLFLVGSGGQSTFNGFLTSTGTQIVPGSVEILRRGGGVIATDDGSGYLNGAMLVGSGTINYFIGNVTFDTTNPLPDGAIVDARYNHFNTGPGYDTLSGNVYRLSSSCDPSVTSGAMATDGVTIAAVDALFGVPLAVLNNLESGTTGISAPLFDSGEFNFDANGNFLPGVIPAGRQVILQAIRTGFYDADFVRFPEDTFATNPDPKDYGFNGIGAWGTAPGAKFENLGVTSGPGIVPYSSTLAMTPIVPGTFIIDLPIEGFTITDDGNGNLVGDVDPGGNNTINYQTGAYDFSLNLTGMGESVDAKYDLGPGVVKETIATGLSGLQVYSGALSRPRVKPGTVNILESSGGLVVKDDGRGNLIGDVDPGGSNTLDYQTGAFNFSLNLTGSGSLIDADYFSLPGVPAGATGVDIFLDNCPATGKVEVLFAQQQDDGTPSPISRSSILNAAIVQGLFCGPILHNQQQAYQLLGSGPNVMTAHPDAPFALHTNIQYEFVASGGIIPAGGCFTSPAPPFGVMELPAIYFPFRTGGMGGMSEIHVNTVPDPNDPAGLLDSYWAGVFFASAPVSGEPSLPSMVCDPLGLPSCTPMSAVQVTQAKIVPGMTNQAKVAIHRMNRPTECGVGNGGNTLAFFHPNTIDTSAGAMEVFYRQGLAPAWDNVCNFWPAGSSSFSPPFNTGGFWYCDTSAQPLSPGNVRMSVNSTVSAFTFYPPGWASSLVTLNCQGIGSGP